MDSKSFGGYLSNIYSQGLIMMGIGLGHELGLVQLLCETTEPMSAADIAVKLHLKERYTREWLSAMAAAKIINIDSETGLFLMPDSHKQELKLRASFAPALFTLSGRKDHVKKCFQKDGPYGFEYEEEPQWFDWFDGYRSSMCGYTIDHEIIPRLQEQGVISRLESGMKVVDIGSGTGSYTLALAQRFPNSHFTGLEYCQRGVTMANKALEEMKLKNVNFVLGNALDLPKTWADSFDWVFVYDTLHDLPDPDQALVEIHKVMKSDASLTIVEMGFSKNPAENAGNNIAGMYYVCSMFICLPSSMSAPPHVGYGACWGMDTLREKLMDKKFNIIKESKYTSIGAKVFVLCTK